MRAARATPRCRSTATRATATAPSASRWTSGSRISKAVASASSHCPAPAMDLATADSAATWSSGSAMSRAVCSARSHCPAVACASATARSAWSGGERSRAARSASSTCPAAACARATVCNAQNLPAWGMPRAICSASVARTRARSGAWASRAVVATAISVSARPRGVGDAASLLLGPVPLPGPGQGLGQRPGGIGPRGAGDAGGDSIGLLPIMEVGLGSDDRDQRRLLAGRVGNAAGVPLDVGEEAGGSVPVDLGHCRADGSDRFGVPRHRVVPASKTLGALQQGNGSVGIVTGHGAAQRRHGRCLLPDVGNGSRGLFGAVPLARGGQGVHHRSQGPGSGGGVHRVDGVGRPLGMLPQPGAGERLGHSGEGERPHMGCGDAPGGLGGLLKQAEGTLPVRPDHRSAHRGQRPRLRICVGDLAPSSRVAASLPGPSER
jgi:hypothetical protein